MLGDGAPQGEEWLPRQLEEIREQLGLLERSVPDSFEPVVKKLQQTIIETIEATYSTSAETTAEIRATVSNPPGSVAAAGDVSGSSVSTPGTVTAGAVSASGGVSAGGDVAASASLRGTDLYATSAPGNNITGTRVAAWLETATGRLGTASSSERFKTNLRPADIDPAVVLAMEPVLFEYVHELQERDRRAALPSPHAQWTPDYQVHTEVGMVAERLHEAGLHHFVVYERDAYGNAMCDDSGHPIPRSIFYEMWSVAQQVVVRDLDRRLRALEERTD